MPEAAVATPVSGDITLRFLELCQFRRLGKVQLDIDKKTTILVGANNSGKTSVLAALRHFLADGMPAVKPLFGDGHAAERICAELLNSSSGR